jgi:hypothetical protein
VVKLVPSVHEVLGSIASIAKKKKEREKSLNYQIIHELSGGRALL